jgi:hypothetical protein
MSEMALTAQHLIVIGRGKLIADDGIDHIIASAGSTVRVISPQQAWQNRADWVIVIHVTPTNGSWTVDNWNASGC